MVGSSCNLITPLYVLFSVSDFTLNVLNIRLADAVEAHDVSGN